VFSLLSNLLNLHNYINYGNQVVISYSEEFFKTDYDDVLDIMYE